MAALGYAVQVSDTTKAEKSVVVKYQRVMKNSGISTLASNLR